MVFDTALGMVGSFLPIWKDKLFSSSDTALVSGPAASRLSAKPWWPLLGSSFANKARI